MTVSIHKNRFVAALLIIISLSSVSSAMEQKEIVKAVLKGKSPGYENSIEFIKTNQPPLIPGILKDEYLDDNDDETRERITSALKLYPPEQIAPIWIEILKTKNSIPMEIHIIEYLGQHRIFTLAIAEKLLAPMSEVRQKAAVILKDSDDDRILPTILKLGESTNPVDRIYFLEALNYIYDVRFQKTVISLLGDENKSVRIYALKCIIANDIKESISGIKKIVISDNNDEVRIRAISALVHFNDTGSGFVISSILKEGKKDLSLAAIKALEELKYSNSSRAISEILLNEKDSDLKNAALDAITAFGRAGNIEGLKYISLEDKDPLMRLKAVYTLGVVAEEKATMDILAQALSDSDYRVRGEACNALGMLKRNRPSSLLLKQIKTDSSRYVRSAALYSLGKIRNDKDLIPLFDIYSSEEDIVFREMLKIYLRSSFEKLIR